MYIHPAGNVQRPGWVPFTSRGQDGMPILRFLVEVAQADRRGSVQAPISQVGAELLQSVSGERRTSIPSCRSVFVRPAGLPPGSLTAHRSRQLASLRSGQGACPLRRSAAIPITLLRHFLPAGHAKHGAAPTGAFDWTQSGQSGAWGNPNKRHRNIENDIPMPCLLRFWLSG